MAERRDACLAFVRMSQAQLPPSEYAVLRQLLQKLTGGHSSAQEVHGHICEILRQHDATELLAHFERLMNMGRPKEISLLLLRQPCGVYVKEGGQPTTCARHPHLAGQPTLPRLRDARVRCGAAGAAARGPHASAFRRACCRRSRVRGQPRAPRCVAGPPGTPRIRSSRAAPAPSPSTFRSLHVSAPPRDDTRASVGARLTGKLSARFEGGVARFPELRVCGTLPEGCRLSFCLRGDKSVPPVQSEQLTHLQHDGAASARAATSAAAASSTSASPLGKRAVREAGAAPSRPPAAARQAGSLAPRALAPSFDGPYVKQPRHGAGYADERGGGSSSGAGSSGGDYERGGGGSSLDDAGEGAGAGTEMDWVSGDDDILLEVFSQVGCTMARRQRRTSAPLSPSPRPGAPPPRLRTPAAFWPRASLVPPRPTAGVERPRHRPPPPRLVSGRRCRGWPAPARRGTTCCAAAPRRRTAGCKRRPPRLRAAPRLPPWTV